MPEVQETNTRPDGRGLQENEREVEGMNQIFTVDQYKYNRQGRRISFSGNWLITHHEANRKQRRKMQKAGK